METTTAVSEPIVVPETAPEGGIMDQVWAEVRGLVKISDAPQSVSAVNGALEGAVGKLRDWLKIQQEKI